LQPASWIAKSLHLGKLLPFIEDEATPSVIEVPKCATSMDWSQEIWDFLFISTWGKCLKIAIASPFLCLLFIFFFQCLFWIISSIPFLTSLCCRSIFKWNISGTLPPSPTQLSSDWIAKQIRGQVHRLLPTSWI